MTEIVHALMADVVPHSRHAYVIGSIPEDVADVVHARCADVVEVAATDVAQVANPRGVVVIGDIETTTSLATERHSWDKILTASQRLMQPGGTLITIVPTDGAFAGLLAATPVTLNTDESRPASLQQLRKRLTALAVGQPVVHPMYGDPVQPAAILRQDIVESATVGSLPTIMLSQALTATALASRERDLMTVMNPDEAIERAVRACALGALASQLIAVVGGQGRAVYTTTLAGEVSWADATDDRRQWVTSNGLIPEAPTFDLTLRKLLALGNLPQFQIQAARVGTWLRTHADVARINDIPFDQLLDLKGTAFLLLSTKSTSDETSVDDDIDNTLARAWWRFLDRLGSDRAALPWPQLTTDSALIGSWLGMSGANPAAANRNPTLTMTSIEHAHTAVARADERSELLHQRVAALTEVLERRDHQLAVREANIWRLREQLLKAIETSELAERAAAVIRTQWSYRLARRVELLSEPRQLMRAVGNRLEKQVKIIRRAR